MPAITGASVGMRRTRSLCAKQRDVLKKEDMTAARKTISAFDLLAGFALNNSVPGLSSIMVLPPAEHPPPRASRPDPLSFSESTFKAQRS
jgi:hypothetical protein